MSVVYIFLQFISNFILIKCDRFECEQGSQIDNTTLQNGRVFHILSIICL